MDNPQIDHNNLKLYDKLCLLGELEHARRHCIRSAHSIEDPEQKFYYIVKAKQLEDIRRKAQHKWAETNEVDWCLVKTATRIKQLNEETFESDIELYSEIENIADDLSGHALDEDLSGCSACKKDAGKQLELK